MYVSICGSGSMVVADFILIHTLIVVACSCAEFGAPRLCLGPWCCFHDCPAQWNWSISLF